MDWPGLFAHVCACTGWTWDYVAEHMDLPRLEALNVYWRDHPPLHIMVAAYLGIKPGAAASAAAPAASETQMAELAELFPTMPKPKILTPEEYFRQKAEAENHGH